MSRSSNRGFLFSWSVSLDGWGREEKGGTEEATE
jgi:hypothetical protein